MSQSRVRAEPRRDHRGGEFPGLRRASVSGLILGDPGAALPMALGHRLVRLDLGTAEALGEEQIVSAHDADAEPREVKLGENAASGSAHAIEVSRGKAGHARPGMT
jgi:hypothetical protein